MKTFKDFITEAWIEFEKKIAGNVEDHSFHPTENADPRKETKPMVDKLNKLMMKGKRKLK